MNENNIEQKMTEPVIHITYLKPYISKDLKKLKDDISHLRIVHPECETVMNVHRTFYDYYNKNTEMVIGNKVYTLAFQIYKERNLIKYAYTVFRKDNKSEFFVKKNHVKTVMGRLDKCPKLMDIDIDKRYKESKFDHEFYQNLVYKIYKEICSNK